MAREAAARYVGLGTTKFDQMVTDGRMPKPKRIDSRVVWDRLLLDAAFDNIDTEPTNLIDEILAGRVIKKPPQVGG